jgi:hypothetical protein
MKPRLREIAHDLMTLFCGSLSSAKTRAGAYNLNLLTERRVKASQKSGIAARPRVLIRWDQHPNGHSRPRLTFEWREVSGPTIFAPGKPGYGMTTIRDLIPYEFGGTVDLALAADGARCRLELPAEWLSNQSEANSQISPPTRSSSMAHCEAS